MFFMFCWNCYEILPDCYARVSGICYLMVFLFYSSLYHWVSKSSKSIFNIYFSFHQEEICIFLSSPNAFLQNAPSYMFDRVLNTPLIDIDRFLIITLVKVLWTKISIPNNTEWFLHVFFPNKVVTFDERYPWMIKYIHKIRNSKAL